MKKRHPYGWRSINIERSLVFFFLFSGCFLGWLFFTTLFSLNFLFLRGGFLGRLFSGFTFCFAKQVCLRFLLLRSSLLCRLFIFNQCYISCFFALFMLCYLCFFFQVRCVF